MNNRKPIYQRNAFILIIIIILLTLGCLLWICLVAPHKISSAQHIADIYQNGELIQSIPLDDVEDSYTFTVIGENGCHNEIEVRNGSIGILSANCPDKLCVNQGFINSSLLPITCLPNHLVIQIREDDTAQETDIAVDIITY